MTTSGYCISCNLVLKQQRTRLRLLRMLSLFRPTKLPVLWGKLASGSIRSCSSSNPAKVSRLLECHQLDHPSMLRTSYPRIIYRRLWPVLACKYRTMEQVQVNRALQSLRQRLRKSARPSQLLLRHRLSRRQVHWHPFRQSQR